MTGFHELRSRLFRKGPAAGAAAPRRAASFEPVFCDQAEAAVAAVKEALAREQPFAVVFLDMRMPPGRDGVWAATHIRELDPAVEIVICTAYSDVDPCEIGSYVPPEDKLSYLQKPFHPHEVRQMTIALASKWRAERRIVKLAYFDTLTGLPNREQSRNRLVGALQSAKENARSWRCCTWIWTTSSASTTPWVTRSATSCCAWWRSACAARCATARIPTFTARPTARAPVISRASAATSSWCCCRTCAARSMRAG